VNGRIDSLLKCPNIKDWTSVVIVQEIKVEVVRHLARVVVVFSHHLETRQGSLSVLSLIEQLTVVEWSVQMIVEHLVVVVIVALLRQSSERKPLLERRDTYHATVTGKNSQLSLFAESRHYRCLRTAEGRKRCLNSTLVFSSSLTCFVTQLHDECAPSLNTSVVIRLSTKLDAGEAKSTTT
jgi:hypothetical protein